MNFNIIALFVDRIIKVSTGIISSILVARYFGVEILGDIYSIIAWRTIFIVVITLGLENYIQREYSQTNIPNIIFSAHIMTRVLVIVVIFPILLLIDYLTNFTLPQKIIIYSCIFYFVDIRENFQKSNGFYLNQLITTIVIYSIIIFFRLLVIYYHLDIYFLAITYAAEITLYLLLIPLMIKNKITFSSFVFKQAKKYIHLGILLVFSALASILYTKIDIIILNYLKGNTDAGLYSSATRISESFFIVPSLILSYCLYLKKKLNINDDLFDRLLIQIGVIISYLIIIPTILFSSVIINILYGKKFDIAENILNIHIFSILFVSLGVMQSIWFYKKNMIWFSTIKNILVAIFSIALNFILINHIGTMGAAISTLLSLLISSFFLNIFNHNTRKLLLLIIDCMLLKHIKVIKVLLK